MSSYHSFAVVCFRQLCIQLSAEDIYRCCAEILLKEHDVKFASCMIQTLSLILLTSTELFELRSQLKELKYNNFIAAILVKKPTQKFYYAIYFSYLLDSVKAYGKYHLEMCMLSEVPRRVRCSAACTDHGVTILSPPSLSAFSRRTISTPPISYRSCIHTQLQSIV